MKESIFEGLREYCPRGYVKRDELKKLTGGLICGRTMAALDHAGKGVENRKIVGRCAVYLIDDFIAWLDANTELINFDN